MTYCARTVADNGEKDVFSVISAKECNAYGENQMKLNYKKTIFVGFAFFLICAFWQAYDSIVPMMLVNKFGLSQTVSGVIMSLDNVIAIFLLPLFGSLSDKTKTRFGRRTPYIVIGTIVAALSFFGLTFADNAQLAKLGNFGENSGYETLCDENSGLGVILRSKGVVRAKDNEKWYYFDLVAGEYEIRTGAPDYTGKICVIGSKIDEDKISRLFSVE